MNNVIYVGKRFTVSHRANLPDYMKGLTGRVTKTYDDLFDVEFIYPPDFLGNREWFKICWVMGYHDQRQGSFDWWPDADYFEHDWQGAADRKRDEIFRAMFKSKGGLFN